MPAKHPENVRFSCLVPTHRDRRHVAFRRHQRFFHDIQRRHSARAEEQSRGEVPIGQCPVIGVAYVGVGGWGVVYIRRCDVRRIIVPGCVVCHCLTSLNSGEKFDAIAVANGDGLPSGFRNDLVINGDGITVEIIIASGVIAGGRVFRGVGESSEVGVIAVL